MVLDDDEPTGPRRLGQQCLRVGLYVVEHVAEQHDIEAFVREGNGLAVKSPVLLPFCCALQFIRERMDVYAAPSGVRREGGDALGDLHVAAARVEAADLAPGRLQRTDDVSDMMGQYLDAPAVGELLVDRD